MISHNVTIKNKYGIHARPSSMISELAQNFKSTIILEYLDKKADASSIMSLILLSIVPGATVTIKINGSDEAEALNAIIDLLEVQLLKDIY